MHKIIKELDNIISKLSKASGIEALEIHLRHDLAVSLFGNEIPGEYKGHKIIIANDIEEIKIDGKSSSSIYILPPGALDAQD